MTHTYAGDFTASCFSRTRLHCFFLKLESELCLGCNILIFLIELNCLPTHRMTSTAGCCNDTEQSVWKLCRDDFLRLSQRKQANN